MIQSVNFLVNDPATLVKEVLSSAVACNPHLYNIPGTQVLTLVDIPKEIGIVCGGGSGHDPSHGGFVSPSILQAVACGNMFTAPTYPNIYEAIKYVNNNNGEKGLLVIITNQQGNIMNFGLAIQQAESEGMKIKQIVVSDDIAFILDEDEKSELFVHRRGLAGISIIYKILGQAKKELTDLESLYQFGMKMNDNVYTIGVGINEKNDNEQPNIEVGLGIHGEKGLLKIPFLKSKELMEKILKMFEKFICQGEEVVILLNNLGSLTDIEMQGLQYDLLLVAKDLKWKIRVLITGKVMSSLNMKGFSITVFRLTKLQEKEKIIEYLLKPTDCPAWNGLNISLDPETPHQKKLMKYSTNLKSRKITEQEMHQILTVCLELQKLEEYFNKLDDEVGDGDLGNTVKSGCRAVQELLQSSQEIRIFDIANKLASSMGGSFGPLFSTFIFGIDKAGLREGLRRLKELGQSSIGDRTVVDVLEPLINEYELNKDLSWKELLEKAEKLTQNTAQLKAKRGRSRYLAGKELGVPDPGCEVIVQILKILCDNS